MGTMPDGVVGVVVYDGEYHDLAMAVYRAECALVEAPWTRGRWGVPWPAGWWPLYDQGAHGDPWKNGDGTGVGVQWVNGNGAGGENYVSMEDGALSWGWGEWDWNDGDAGYDVELDQIGAA